MQAAKTKRQSIPLLAESIQANFKESIENIVASESEILIYGSEDFKLEELDDFNLNQGTSRDEIFEIKVNLESGLDWDQVMRVSGKTKDEFKKMLKKTKFSLSMYGFRPGFLYLNGLPLPYQIPRRKLPRKEVAAGSLALGGKYIGIYGSVAPAGWNVIGTTDFMVDKFASTSDLPSIKQQIKFLF